MLVGYPMKISQVAWMLANKMNWKVRLAVFLIDQIEKCLLRDKNPQRKIVIMHETSAEELASYSSVDTSPPPPPDRAA